MPEDKYFKNTLPESTQFLIMDAIAAHILRLEGDLAENSFAIRVYEDILVGMFNEGFDITHHAWPHYFSLIFPKIMKRHKSQIDSRTCDVCGISTFYSAEDVAEHKETKHPPVIKPDSRPAKQIPRK